MNTTEQSIVELAHTDDIPDMGPKYWEKYGSKKAGIIHYTEENIKKLAATLRIPKMIQGIHADDIEAGIDPIPRKHSEILRDYDATPAKAFALLLCSIHRGSFYAEARRLPWNLKNRKAETLRFLKEWEGRYPKTNPTEEYGITKRHAKVA